MQEGGRVSQHAVLRNQGTMSMTKERELLKKIKKGDDDGDFFITSEIYNEIRTMLAQPEQEPYLTELDGSCITRVADICSDNEYDAFRNRLGLDE